MSDQSGDFEKPKKQDLQAHTFLITSGLLKKIGQAAQKRNLSKNAIVREALEQYFARDRNDPPLQAVQETQAHVAEQLERLLTLEIGAWLTVHEQRPTITPDTLMQKGQDWLKQNQSEGEEPDGER